MKKKILVLLLTTLMTFLCSYEIEILEMSESYLKLKFVLPDYQIERGKGLDNVNDSIEISDAEFSQEIGRVSLPYFAEAIGLPVDGKVETHILSQREKLYKDVRLARSPELFEESGQVIERSIIPLESELEDGFYPEKLVSTGKSAFIGDRHFTTLRLAMFRYDEAKRLLKVCEELELEVYISGDKQVSRGWVSSNNFIDNSGDSFFLNNEYSQKWRKSRELITEPNVRTSTYDVLDITVMEDGIYKVSYEYLEEQLALIAEENEDQLDWRLDSINPRNLQLESKAGLEPLYFYGEEDEEFNPGDYFEFYGKRNSGEQSYYGAYTSENVYKLKIISGLGSRMAVENGGLTVTNENNYIEPDYYEEKLHFESQNCYDRLSKAFEVDNDFYREDIFFWRKISAPNLDIVELDVPYPSNKITDKFSFKASIMGITSNVSDPNAEPDINGEFDHSAIVRLNQALIDSKIWNGQREEIFASENELGCSYLKKGKNYVYISLPGNSTSGEKENIALDYIDLTYWRQYITDTDKIKFSKPSDKPNGYYQFKVEGFASDSLSVYKIGSSKFENINIEPIFEHAHSKYEVKFQDEINSGNIEYYAVSEREKKLPFRLRIDHASNLRSTQNSYDCLIISDKELIQSEGSRAYQNLWNSKGHRTLLVDQQDIYDEFNSGVRSADAIKDFLHYAYNNWSLPQIKYVLLLGDQTSEIQDKNIDNVYNVIPYKNIWTLHYGAAPSDSWYGCIVGDDCIPDIIVSRICVWEAEQILPVADKSEVMFNAVPQEDLGCAHVLLTAGGKVQSGNDNFALASEEVKRRMISDSYYVKRVYAATSEEDFYGSTFDLKDEFNQGVKYLQFMGHGGGRVWADYNLLNIADISTLNNSYYPLVSSLSCFGSSYCYPGDSSISEAFITEPERGAINSFGFSGYGWELHNKIFGDSICDGLFRRNFTTIGEVINYAKVRYYVKSYGYQREGLTYTSILMGDPLVPIQKPKGDLKIETDKEFYALGDTIKVSVTTDLNIYEAKLMVLNEKGVLKNISYNLPVINGHYEGSWQIPTTSVSTEFYQIRVESYDNSNVYYGNKIVGVGESSISNIKLIPEIPTVYADSIGVECTIFAEGEISDVKLSYYDIDGWENISMKVDSDDSNKYQLSEYLKDLKVYTDYKYKISFVNSDGMLIESQEQLISILAPDLMVKDCFLGEKSQQPAIYYTVANVSDIATIPTSIKIKRRLENDYNYEDLFVSELPALVANESFEGVYILEDFPLGDYVYKFIVNEEDVFSETSSPENFNNQVLLNIPMNYQLISSAGGEVASLDNNVKLLVPADYGDNILISVNKDSYCKPYLQPDVKEMKLANGDLSTIYDYKCFNSALVDSLGNLTNGNLDIVFTYDASDTLAVAAAEAGELDVFRWNNRYKKWSYQGGFVSKTNHTVRANVSRLGIFTLLRNRDKVIPAIEPNVQDQEFSAGGYVAGDGCISVILSDANGIDIDENRFKLYLNGKKLDEAKLSVNLNDNNINNIPLKYQLDIPSGNYSFVVDCTDINGNFNSYDISFKVSNKFEIINVANYPNPIVSKGIEPVNDGRTRFTYTLTNEADDVKIEVYTVSGRKVKVFKNLPNTVGYHEYPRTNLGWDCRDSHGLELANGVYFYKVIAKRGSKHKEKIMKMAILK